MVIPSGSFETHYVIVALELHLTAEVLLVLTHAYAGLRGY